MVQEDSISSLIVFLASFKIVFKVFRSGTDTDELEKYLGWIGNTAKLDECHY